MGTIRFRLLCRGRRFALFFAGECILYTKKEGILLTDHMLTIASYHSSIPEDASNTFCENNFCYTTAPKDPFCKTTNPTTTSKCHINHTTSNSIHRTTIKHFSKPNLIFYPANLLSGRPSYPTPIYQPPLSPVGWSS